MHAVIILYVLQYIYCDDLSDGTSVGRGQMGSTRMRPLPK